MTSEPVVLDTDVASLSLKGKLSLDVLRQLDGRVPLITFVTLAKLTRWVEQRQWGAHRRELLSRWLVGKHLLHSDDDVARTWGAITAYAYFPPSEFLPAVLGIQQGASWRW